MTQDLKSPYTFTLEEPDPRSQKPLPVQTKKRGVRRGTVVLPNVAFKYEAEFYDVIRHCAEYIDKRDRDSRIDLHKKLTRIFAERSTPAAMRFFRDLVNYELNKKEPTYYGKD